MRNLSNLLPLPSKHSSWWRRTEDFLKTSWRRLQHNIFLSFKTSWRCLQDIIPRRLLEDIFLKTSWRSHLADTSWRRLGRRLEDVLKTSWRRLRRWKFVTLKTSWKTRNVYRVIILFSLSESLKSWTLVLWKVVKPRDCLHILLTELCDIPIILPVFSLTFMSSWIFFLTKNKLFNFLNIFISESRRNSATTRNPCKVSSFVNFMQ